MSYSTRNPSNRGSDIKLKILDRAKQIDDVNKKREQEVVSFHVIPLIINIIKSLIAKFITTKSQGTKKLFLSTLINELVMMANARFTNLNCSCNNFFLFVIFSLYKLTNVHCDDNCISINCSQNFETKSEIELEFCSSLEKSFVVLISTHFGSHE